MAIDAIFDLKRVTETTRRYEQQVAPLPNDGPHGESKDSEKQMNLARNFAEAQQAIILADNRIDQLEARIASLEQIEKRATKLQTALDRRHQTIRQMQDQIGQSKGELFSLRGLPEVFRKNMDKLRAELEEAREHEEHIQAMKGAIEVWHKGLNQEVKRNIDLEWELARRYEELKRVEAEFQHHISQT